MESLVYVINPPKEINLPQVGPFTQKAAANLIADMQYDKYFKGELFSKKSKGLKEDKRAYRNAVISTIKI